MASEKKTARTSSLNLGQSPNATQRQIAHPDIITIGRTLTVEPSLVVHALRAVKMATGTRVKGTVRMTRRRMLTALSSSSGMGLEMLMP